MTEGSDERLEIGRDFLVSPLKYAILKEDMQGNKYEKVAPAEVEPEQEQERGRKILQAEQELSAQRQASREAEQTRVSNITREGERPDLIRVRSGGKILKTANWAMYRGSELTPPAERARQEAERKPVPVRSLQMRIEDFVGVYPDAKLRRDEQYVRDFRLRSNTVRIDDYEEAEESRQFEQIFLQGVQVARWLGNTGIKREERDGLGEFSTLSFEAADYDDLRHRVDIFTLMKFQRPPENEAKVKFRTLPVGFDLTLMGDRNKILDKLTRSCNDEDPLPFGFTRVDYFTDGKKRMGCPIMPRYVIGLNSNEVDLLMRQTTENARHHGFGLLSKTNLRTRFRVLAELRAQNALFEAMLPENAYENPSKNVRVARACIEVADREFNHALTECAQDMVHFKALPTSVLAKITENPHKMRKTIEDYLLWEGQTYFQQNRQERMTDGMAEGKYYKDAFVQVMMQVRKLTEAARNGGSEEFPLIDLLKPEQPRNQSILKIQKTTRARKKR